VSQTFISGVVQEESPTRCQEVKHANQLPTTKERLQQFLCFLGIDMTSVGTGIASVGTTVGLPLVTTSILPEIFSYTTFLAQFFTQLHHTLLGGGALKIAQAKTGISASFTASRAS